MEVIGADDTNNFYGLESRFTEETEMKSSSKVQLKWLLFKKEERRNDLRFVQAYIDLLLWNYSPQLEHVGMIHSASKQVF